MDLSIAVSFFALALMFKVKHFLADFVFQTTYMLGKFRLKGWVKPLSSHCLTHSFFTFGIVYGYLMEKTDDLFYYALFAAVFDFVIHFTMDRVKASPNLLGRYNIKQKAFWVSLGFDQMVHDITHYVIILCVILISIG